MGTPHKRYDPEFKLMVAKKIVHDGITTYDAEELFGIKYQRAEDWAIDYIKKGGPDRITGSKSDKEIERDKLLLKAVRLEYKIEKMKKEAISLRADADRLDKKIKAEKSGSNA